jgi:hypothetical protein
MGLLARATSLEAIGNLDIASQQRLLDGVQLALQDGHETGAIYLLGYSVEMQLKIGYYRATGLSRWSTVDRAFRALVGSSAYRAHGAGAGTGHSLRGLYEAWRANTRLADPVFVADLGQRVDVLSRHWSEQLRYRRTRATRVEVNEAYDAAQWIMVRRSLLR